MVHKRKTRNDIIEEYWPDFLLYCFDVAIKALQASLKGKRV